jgi:hypothetical protein
MFGNGWVIGCIQDTLGVGMSEDAESASIQPKLGAYLGIWSVVLGKGLCIQGTQSRWVEISYAMGLLIHP